MNFNIDCVRAVLLELEDRLAIEVDEVGSISNNHVRPADLVDILGDDFRQEEIYYVLKKLGEEGYIKLFAMNADNLFLIYYIDEMTFKGHQFIETIRPQPVWDKTKEAVKKFGSASFSFIAQVAGEALASYFKGTIA